MQWLHERFTTIVSTSLQLRSLSSIEHELQLNLRKGLLPVGLLAALSVYSCLVLLGFIATRFYSEWKRCRTSLGHNQYVVLVFNLLVAGEGQIGTCFYARTGSANQHLQISCRASASS